MRVFSLVKYKLYLNDKLHPLTNNKLNLSRYQSIYLFRIILFWYVNSYVCWMNLNLTFVLSATSQVARDLFNIDICDFLLIKSDSWNCFIEVGICVYLYSVYVYVQKLWWPKLFDKQRLMVHSFLFHKDFIHSYRQ